MTVSFITYTRVSFICQSPSRCWFRSSYSSVLRQKFPGDELNGAGQGREVDTSYRWRCHVTVVFHHTPRTFPFGTNTCPRPTTLTREAVAGILAKLIDGERRACTTRAPGPGSHRPIFGPSVHRPNGTAV
jgi:hypothetical protein